MKNLILTASLGDRPFKKYAFFSMEEYAKKTNADFIVAEDIEIPKELKELKVGRGNNTSYLKKILWIRKYLKEYDKVLWLDDTCYVNPNCPNLFNFVPSGYVAAASESQLMYVGFKEAYKDFLKRWTIYKNERDTTFNTGVILYTKECKHMFSNDNLLNTIAKLCLTSQWPQQLLTNYLIIINNIPRIVLDSKFNRMHICEKYEPYIERRELISEKEGKIKDVSDEFFKKNFKFNKKLLKQDPFVYEAFIYHLAGKSKEVRENLLKQIHKTFSKVKI